MNPRPPMKWIVPALAILAFLAPLKFTQPSILPQMVPWPGTLLAWVFQPWPPLIWNILWLATVAAVLASASWSRLRIRHGWMPAAFLAIQFLSAMVNGNPPSCHPVLLLFASLGAAFYLGAAFLRDADDLETLGFALLAASALVILSGLFQIFIGFESMKESLARHPELAGLHDDLWARLMSGRVFATFTSPNALGAFAAASFFVVAHWMTDPRPQGEERSARRWVGAAALFGLFFCVWQSRSRAALAVFLVLALLMVSRWMRHRAWKLLLPSVLGVALIAAFMHEHSHDTENSGAVGGFVESADARGAYWRTAFAIARENPILGSGPGSFQDLYPKRKTAGAGMTRLAHNDYLQMGSESGLLGFVAFVVWLPGTLVLWMWRWRNAPEERRRRPLLLWCAAAVFALHSLVDYDLYMVGNSWPIFLLLGHLSQSGPEATTPDPSGPSRKSK